MRLTLHPLQAMTLSIALVTLLAACGNDSATVTTDKKLAAAVESESAPETNEALGYVFTQWGYDIPKDNPGECPEGFNKAEDEYFKKEYAAVADEVKQRYEAGDREGALKLLPPDTCQDPMVQPDPGHILMQAQASVTGLDLDGAMSKASAGKQCAHDDFADGIDNQFWRLMGCVKGFQPNAQFDRMFDERSAITENGFSTLLELKLVEGTRENGRVQAQLFTSAGPVLKDANGNVIPDASQIVHEDKLYHSDVFAGEIKDGVLTAGPVDAKLRFKVQAIDNHYWFRDLKIRAEMLPDGGMTGVLAGYWDIDNAFDFLTEVYIGKVHLGRAAANTAGYMCAGVFHALPRVADGHPDPETGECTSMSTVVRFEAIPAFVIRPDAVATAE